MIAFPAGMTVWIAGGMTDMPVSRVHELLPWHWKAATELKRIAA